MNITDPIRKFAREQPDVDAVIRPNGVAVSFRDLDRMIDFMAARIRNLELGADATVGIRTSRPYRDLCCRLALARLGVCVVPRPLPMKAVTLCLTDEPIPKENAAKFLPLERIWVEDLDPGVDVPEVPANADGKTLYALNPTSGTTGTPKFVAMSHEIIARRLALRPAALRPPPGARQVCTIGAGTGYGFLHRLWVLCDGGTIVMTSQAGKILPAIVAHRVSHLAMAPFSLDRLLKELAPDATPIPSLKLIEVGGGVLPMHLHDRAREHLCPMIVTQYGTSECGPIAGAPIHAMRDRPGAVGYVYPGVEVRVVDADDNPLPLGGEGLICVRSAACVDAYIGDPESSARHFRRGWVYTGDMGSLSSDGLLTLVGRTSEVINQGGIKINPQIIEDVLLSVDMLGEAAAFGVPDPMGIERIWAAIVPNGKWDREALRALCRERLKSSAPTTFMVMKALPRNENGKVLREPLRQKAIALLARQKVPPATP